MKLLAFAASNSRTSINKRLVQYVSRQYNLADCTMLDLNDYEMPIYSIDREKESGIPQLAKDFKKQIKNTDKVMISFAEHNGSYTVAFKNLMDWMSRIEGDTWESKPFFLMATSPGGRGGRTVLDTAIQTFGHMGAKVRSQFSLPDFYKNFDDEKGILDQELAMNLEEQMDKFSAR